MRRVTLSLVLCLFMNMLAAQFDSNNISSNEQYQPPFCAADAYRDILYSKNPALQKKREQIEAYQKSNAGINAKTGGLPIVIPVVVHIVHDPADNLPGMGTNISDAQVRRAIQWLNDGFDNSGVYADALYPLDATGASSQIEFCLADVDSLGNPTNGITRTPAPSGLVPVDPASDLTLKTSVPFANGGLPAGAWDQFHYLNIWVVDQICAGGIGCFVQGYSTLATSNGLPEDGIVMDADFFGTTPEATTTLVHEAGHFCDLEHTFNGQFTNGAWFFLCQDNDGINDTPIDETANPFPPYPCGTTILNCQGVAELMDNFMDYANTECVNNFTPGQGTWMQNTFGTATDSGLRYSFCTPPSPIGCATGPYCNTNASFTSTVNNANPFQFNFLASNPVSGATYTWDFGDNGAGTTIGATTLNPTHTYIANGTYNVCLTITDPDPACGIDQQCHDITIFIPDDCNCNTPMNLLLNSGFDNVGTPGNLNASANYSTQFGVYGQTPPPPSPSGPGCYPGNHFVGTNLGDACSVFAGIALNPHSAPNMVMYDGLEDEDHLGNPTSGIVVAQGGIPVVDGETYLTSFWFNHYIPNGSQGQRPVLEVYVVEDNGAGTQHLLGRYFQGDLSSSVWQELCNEWTAFNPAWTSTNPGLVEFRIVQDNSVNAPQGPYPTGGADHYAIDDMFFGTCTCNTTAAFNWLGPICVDESKTFTNTSINGATYEWFVDGSLVSTAQDLVHSFPIGGSHTIQLIANNGICTDIITQSIVMPALVSSSFTVNPAQPCVGDPVTLTYGGMFNNVFSINNQPIPSVGGTAFWTPTTAGTYYITNLVQLKGCPSETTVVVEVIDCCKPTMPTNLNCVINGSARDLTWDPVPGITAYEVSITYDDPNCCKTNNGNNSLPISTVYQVVGTSFQVSGLNNCFSWSVRSVCDDGTSGRWTKPLCSCDRCKINPPKNLYCESGTGLPTQIVAWSIVPNAVSYEVTINYGAKKCCKKFNGLPFSQLIPTTSTSLTLPTNSCFSFSVRAICADGTKSVWSATRCSCEELITPPCNLTTPSGLDCIQQNPGDPQQLVWTPIPGALDYVVTVIVNDPACCTNGGPVGVPASRNTGGIAQLIHTDPDVCFSWTVQAKCANGPSPVSAPACSCTSPFAKPADNDTQEDQMDDITVATLPNPADQQITINITSSENKSNVSVAKLVIRSVSGELVFEQAVVINSTSTIATDKMADGIYIYHVITQNSTHTGKFVVQH